MNEEQRNQEEKKVEEGQEESGGKIELDVDTYQALLDRLDELESAGKKSSNPIKDLADEGRGRQQPVKQEEVDLDGMSQSELAGYIVQQIGQQFVHPVSVEMQGIKLALEIDKLEKDEDYGPAFKEHQDKVFELATENPKLSLKQATAIAVKEASKTSKSETSDKVKDRDARLRHLPKAFPHSERPGTSSGTMKKEEPKDRKGAAERAIEELGIKFNA